MAGSPLRSAVTQNTSDSPIFTLGSITLSHAPRQWERTAISPLRRPQRKGTKVWKRRGLQSKDALVSAQLLNDLAASVESHASKRQRIQQMPAVPAQMQTEPYYAPISYNMGTPGLKRKVTEKRRRTRNSLKQLPQEIPSDTSKATAETGISKASFQVYPPSPCRISPCEGSKVDFESSQDLSFLDMLNLHGKCVFENNSRAMTKNPSASSQDVHRDDGGEVCYSIFDEQIGRHLEDRKEEREDEEFSRIEAAGHTGIIRFDKSTIQLGNSFKLDSDISDAFVVDTDGVDKNLNSSTTHEKDIPSLCIDEGTCLMDSASIDIAYSGNTSEDSSFEQEFGEQSNFEKRLYEEPGQNKRMELSKPLLASPSIKASEADPIQCTASMTTGIAALLDEEPSEEGLSQRPRKKTGEAESGANLDELKIEASELSTRQAGDLVNSASFSNNDKSNGTKIMLSLDDCNEKPIQDSRSARSAVEEDYESADELFIGAPTPQKIIFSPAKNASAHNLSPKKIRSGPRLSDDTTYLNDFLSRVRSQAAARSQDSQSYQIKAQTTPKSTRQSPRKPLSELVSNSLSPSPRMAQSQASPSKEKRTAPAVSGDGSDSPVRLPKTPIARALLSGNLDTPETPDELCKPPSLPLSRKEGASVRRSNRTKSAAPSKLPLNIPSNIPLRRTDGDPPVLHRSDAQKLARTTAANTRRNKGGARFPKQVIESLDGRLLSPVKNKGMVKNKKGQNVDWDHRLVYYLEDTGKEVEIDSDGKVIEKENGQEVLRRVRIIKGERVDQHDGSDESEAQSGMLENQEKITRDDEIGKISDNSHRSKIAPTITKPIKPGDYKIPKNLLPLSIAPATKGRRALISSKNVNSKGTHSTKRLVKPESAMAMSKRKP